MNTVLPCYSTRYQTEYIGTESYTAGKTFTLKLTFSTDGSNDGEKLTLDGEVATEDAVVEGVSVLVK